MKLITAREVARLAGVSTVASLQGRIDAGTFPVPIVVSDVGRLWDDAAVQAALGLPADTDTETETITADDVADATEQLLGTDQPSSQTRERKERAPRRRPAR